MRHNRFFLCFVLLGSIVPFGCTSEKRYTAPPPETPHEAGLPDTSDVPDPLREEVARRADAAAAAGFSGAIVVTVEGRSLLARGYGLADRTRQVANEVDTAFAFGSVMKVFTSAAVFKLAGEDKLAVTDRLDAIFDDVPADKAPITILQILRHAAGFHTYHDEEGDFEPMTRLEARQRIFDMPLLFEPGTKQSYSNAGYTLLADIVETVSGRAFTEYVRSELFAPAGMKQSGFPGDPLWKELDTAIGYGGSTYGDNDPASWPHTWALVGNGGLVTTVSDIERWAKAIWNGGVFSPATFDAYRSSYLAGGAHDIGGKTAYVSAGAGDYGFGGFVLDCPDVDTRVIIGTNTYEAFDIEAFGAELGELVLSAK